MLCIHCEPAIYFVYLAELRFTFGSWKKLRFNLYVGEEYCSVERSMLLSTPAEIIIIIAVSIIITTHDLSVISQFIITKQFS